MTRRVHDSCAGRRAGFGGEGEWRGGSAELLGCPREPVRPHLPHHRHLACLRNLPDLYARGEGQTGKKLPVRDFGMNRRVFYSHIDSDQEHHACRMMSTRIVSCCGQK